MLQNRVTQYKAYTNATHTVAKTRQIVMLYDGMIRFMKQAREAIVEKDYAKRYNLLVKVSEIVMGLQGSIDFESGGDVAHVLFDFYSSIDARIQWLHRSNELEESDKIVADLKEMRDIWAQIDNGQVKVDPASITSQPQPAQASVGSSAGSSLGSGSAVPPMVSGPLSTNGSIAQPALADGLVISV